MNLANLTLQLSTLSRPGLRNISHSALMTQGATAFAYLPRKAKTGVGIINDLLMYVCF